MKIYRFKGGITGWFGWSLMMVADFTSGSWLYRYRLGTCTRVSFTTRLKMREIFLIIFIILGLPVMGMLCGELFTRCFSLVPFLFFSLFMQMRHADRFYQTGFYLAQAGRARFLPRDMVSI